MMRSQNTEDNTHEFARRDRSRHLICSGCFRIDTVSTSFSYGRNGPMKSRGLLAVACAAMLMAGCNRGNRASNTIANSNDAGTTGTAGYSISTSDKNFVNDILSDGMAEVETAKLATNHAANMPRSSTRST
jgi:hypothetical protein